MKIFCCDFLNLTVKNGNFFIKFLLLAVTWMCYCCQGDEARHHNLSYKKLVTWECHVTLKGTVHKHVTPACRCKCSIWCREFTRCNNVFNNHTNYVFLEVLNGTHRTCCESSPNSQLHSASQGHHLQCNGSELISNSSGCDIDWKRESSYFVFCTEERRIKECSSFLHPSPRRRIHLLFENGSLLILSGVNSRRKKNLFRSRFKRSQRYSTPYRIEVQNKINSNISILQPFDIEASILDAKNNIVDDIEGDLTLQISDDASRKSHLIGGDKVKVVSGRGRFLKLYFSKTGQNYKLSIVYSGATTEVLPWTSVPINVIERQLVLKPSGRTLPISPRENDTLSPAAGVVIYDLLDNKPANRRYLSQYTWESSIGLLFADVYPGDIIGTTFRVVEDGSSEILFNDIIISGWGYSYILRIQVRARETAYWDLSCLIGPFNVDMIDTFELPLIESNEFRRVQVVFDGDFQKVKMDKRKFEIFFLNHFGRKYPKVRWRNVTVSEGSIVVDAIIAGLTEELDKTSETLANDINSGKADIDYEDGKTWRASRVLPSRKLLEDEGNNESQTSDEGGGLSVAWIVAIVINVILIIIFIIAVVYCWMRRKKLEENENDPPGYPSPSPEPVFPTPLPTPEKVPDEDFWRPESFPQEEPEEIYIPEPEPVQEMRFYVYHLHDVEGSRDLISEIVLPTNLFLNDVRKIFTEDRRLSRAINKREYRFIDEYLKVVPTYTESSVSLDNLYSNNEIYLQYQLPAEPPPKKIKMPAYVGPLGICSAEECVRAAKIKCLDCRNTAYCSKRCMQEDVKDHRRACYKPAWRL